MTSMVDKSSYGKNTGTIASLFKITVWALVLIFLPQFILGFVFSIFLGIQQGANLTPDAIDTWFTSIPTQLLLSLISLLIFIPLLAKATNANGWGERLVFWAVKPINRKETGKWLSIGLIYWICSSLLAELLNLPPEQFMLDIKAASNSFIMLVLAITTICIVIPVMEELIFRGWLFSKIKQTKLGELGALIITSLGFTAIHTQYNNVMTLLFIFALGLLLGGVRYKTQNTSYAIAIHIFFNSLAMFALFFFEI